MNFCELLNVLKIDHHEWQIFVNDDDRRPTLQNDRVGEPVCAILVYQKLEKKYKCVKPKNGQSVYDYSTAINYSRKSSPANAAFTIVKYV